MIDLHNFLRQWVNLADHDSASSTSTFIASNFRTSKMY